MSDRPSWETPDNAHYALPETWRDVLAAQMTPAYVSPESLWGGGPCTDQATTRECLGTLEFTHGELTARNGACHVCGGYGHE